MIRKIIYTVFLLIAPFVLLAQNAAGVKHIEEVKERLAVSEADTNRVLLIIDLCTAYQWTNIDSLGYYSEMGIKLAQRLNFARGEIRILNNQGIGVLFRGDIPKALNILYRALRLAENNNYPMETAISLNNIGSCYFSLNDHSRSLEFLRRAVALNATVRHSPKDVYWKIYIDFWLGTEFIYVNKMDSAELYISKAYKEAFDPGFTDLYSLRPTILMFYGYMRLKQKRFDLAYDYLGRAINIYDVYNDVFGGADAYTYMAMVFKEQNKPDSAIYYAKKGLDISLNNDYKASVLNNSTLLAELYEPTHPALALKYLKIRLETSDSLYGSRKIQDLQKTLSEEQQQDQQLQEEQIAKQNQLRQNGFLAGLGVLLIIAFILFINNRHRKKANILLQQQKDKVEITLSELKSTQAQLIQSEKMASLGELTTGIAHEIQNPLNFVNNFSEVNSELTDEIADAVKNGNIQEVSQLASQIRSNQEKILEHGRRADAIVKSMLQHSLAGTGQKESTDINAVCEEYLRLAYHGMRARDKSFNADLKTDFDRSIGKINIIPRDIGRVLLNLYNNAFYACTERSRSAAAERSRSAAAERSRSAVSENLKQKLLYAEGSENPRGGVSYVPLTSVTTRKKGNYVEISVEDNGNGIPDSIKVKIFQPFFTTKPTGQGTGLGLSLSYDIVKSHGGNIKCVSNSEGGAMFTILLPLNNQV